MVSGLRGCNKIMHVNGPVPQKVKQLYIIPGPTQGHRQTNSQGMLANCPLAATPPK